MDPWLIWLTGAVVLLGALLVVLYRRQRLNRGADLWAPGQERGPRLGRATDTSPHSDGGGTGNAGDAY